MSYASTDPAEVKYKNAASEFTNQLANAGKIARRDAEGNYSDESREIWSLTIQLFRAKSEYAKIADRKSVV